MTDLTDRIKARGYWDVYIRPGDYDPERVAYDQLGPTISGAAVRMRGWPVPYFDHGGILHGADWIGQKHESQVGEHREAWRFWTSGQFAHLTAIGADWRGSTRVPEGFDSVIEVWAIVFYLTEITELAARLALTPAGADLIEVKATLGAMRNRALVVGQSNRHEFFEPYRSDIDHYTLAETVPRESLVANSAAVAAKMSREVLLRFGWNVSIEQLTEHQRELTRD